MRLNAGTIKLEENLSTITKQQDFFEKTYYLDKHYVVLQFKQLPTEAQKNTLKGAGVVLIDYIPNNAYTAILPLGYAISNLQANGIRSILAFSAEQKAMPNFFSTKVPTHAIKQFGYADVTILTYEALKGAAVINSINEVGGSIISEAPIFRMLTIRIPAHKIKQLASLSFIQWIEFIDPPNQPENLPGRSLHRVNILQDGVRNLKGDGMNIGVWDEIASQHLDFSPAGRLTNVETGGAGSHGTHVSGTIGGKGIINPIAKGMAPNANIYSYNGFNNDVQVEMATAIPANTLISSNHSYHDGLGVQCGTSGASVSYSVRARNTDINLNNFNYHIHCHSSGNAQSSCASGWGTITGTGKASKNNLVVGNITSTELLSGSSSCGPVHDGRVKPEIVAMGTNVFSTYTPLNTYNTISGTSMSTPGITGTVALLAQRYKQLNGNVLPPSTLIKNIACNTATDLGTIGPDYRFGFGRVNALKAVKIIEENRYVLNDVITGQTRDITITIPAGAAKLNVMLTWNDPAGTANAAVALVNNLDLTVIDGASLATLPWILNPNSPATPATKAIDNISNIEQVTIDNPLAGTYTLRVNGAAIATGPNQTYALTWTVDQPYIEVTYPNGNELFSPGVTETITWDNAGVTGNQTVEYSLDGVTNWTAVGTVSAATTRLTWTVPAANTAAARVRITSGALTDMSDAGFKILGTVTGFSGNGASCNAGEITFNWTAVSNASNYDIYRLDATIADFVLLASNITGTTYTATGLTPNTNMWFTIRAKNNTSNAVSERALAINVTVSNGGGGLGAVGTITGSSIICGPQSSVSYSIATVSGASSYTWAAPPGASIISGQGSTNITISYPTGSTNGNVGVFASNGSCNTTPNNLAVTVNNTPVAAATSGGNQTQNVCAGNTIPTLTASAAVPAGHSVVWYDAATGGNIISNPILNTTGTITYYAISKENNSGCESATRTAVTLTINSIAAATVTANGNTTFCQGNSVTLTATAGSSYAWSNGASTQSVVINTSGAYAVTVVNNGCSTTTPAINVTVNPTPVASVAANGVTTFCQGANVLLSANAAASYLWSNGATSQSISVSNSGNYSVTITNANGCTATSATTPVSVSPNPVVSISASPFTRLHPGLTTTLTASVTPAGSYNYTWFKNNTVIAGTTGNTLADITIEKLGSYAVTVTNTSGLPCSNTSNIIAIADSATTKLYILPNPNSGVFDVVYHSTANTSYMLTITDGKGALVYKKANAIYSPYQRMPVDIRQHGKGLYFVSVFDVTGKKVATAKVVTQ